jgi:PAS domain S-box-containing protein
MPTDLRQLSPRSILAGTFALFLVPFLLVELFPAQLDMVVDKSSYLVFHNIAEIFSIVVSLSVFSVGWITYDQSKDRHALFLSTAFLAVGLLDLMHTLSNAAMPPFLTPNSTNKSTQFWIAARLFDASAFLASAYIYPDSRSRWLSRKPLLASVLVLTGAIFTGVVFFPSHLPATAVPGVGLTPLKRYLEFLVIMLLAAAASAYYQRMKQTGDRSLVYYPASFIICMFSEGVFASYTTGFDTYNVLGHIYKVAAFFLIFRMVFIAAVKAPYERLANEERLRHLASFPQLNPNPVLEVDRSGEIVYCNPAVRRFLENCCTGGEGGRMFLPPDMDRILSELENHEESAHYREITVGDRVFGQTVQLVPQFGKVRLYCFDITERRRAEAALRENELRASALINAADGSIWLFGLQGEILTANTTAARRLGLRVDEVVGRRWPDLLPPDLVASRAQRIDEIVRTREPVRFVDERAGITFGHSAYPVRDEQGTITAVAFFSRDITEIKRAEEERERLVVELERRAVELDAVFKVLPYLVSVHGMDGRYLRANPAIVNLFGFDPVSFPREEIARRVNARFPDGRPVTRENMPSNRALKGETVSGVEYLITDARGEERVLLMSAIPLQLDGQVYGAVFAQLDITERKRAEEELLQARNELENRVRERTGDLAATVETLLGEIADRERAEKSLQRLNSLYAVLSETNQAIVRAGDRDALFNDFCRIAVEDGGFLLAWVGLVHKSTGQLAMVAACGATGYLDDIRITRNDEPTGLGPTGISVRAGTYYVCNDFQNDPCTRPWHERGKAHGIKASASVALKEEGVVIGALTLYAGERDFFDQQHVELLVQMGADVSFALDNLMREARRQEAEQALREETLERLRVVEALREKEQMLLQQSRLAAMGEMINNIAHQWRQPLNVLGLLVQQLQMSYEMGSLSKDDLSVSVDKSMGLINHMSRTIDDFRNYFRPDKEPVLFSIREVVERTVSLVEDSFRNHQIGIDFRAGASPSIVGFPNEYSQALLNIMMNARDALLEKRPDNAMVTISVTREGERAVVIIADNGGGIPAEIMDKIFEPYFTTKGPDRGTGVGLFMSKTIIEKNMHGMLTVRNTAVGAEFRIEV